MLFEHMLLERLEFLVLGRLRHRIAFRRVRLPLWTSGSIMLQNVRWGRIFVRFIAHRYDDGTAGRSIEATDGKCYALRLVRSFVSI